MRFFISLTEELSEADKSGIAHFDGIGDVCLERLNCHTLAGTIPGRFNILGLCMHLDYISNYISKCFINITLQPLKSLALFL